MKQNFPKLTILFVFFLLAFSLQGQSRFYDVSIDGINGTIVALSGDLPAPCTITITGELVAGTPVHGCNPLTTPNDLGGKIVVLDRGFCFFVDKIKHAQEAGAIAAIICNNRPETESDGGVIAMGGEDRGEFNLFATNR